MTAIQGTSSRGDLDFPEGWATARVEELSCSIQYGYTASAIPSSTGIRFLRITDIQNGNVDWEQVPSCTISPDRMNRFSLAAGDIVFARTGATTGKSFLIRECPEAVFASYLIRIRPSSAVHPSFLQLFFQTPEYWQAISENVSGNAQPNCNATKLGGLPLRLPPAAEQERIVAKVKELLERVNAARQRLAKVPTLLKRFRQSVLAAACSGQLTANWRERTRDPESARYPLIDDGVGLDSAVPDLAYDLPETWRWRRLGRVVKNHDSRRVPVKQEDRAKRTGRYPYYGAFGVIDHIDDFLFDGRFVLMAEDGKNLESRLRPIAIEASGRFWVNNHAHVLEPLWGMPHAYLVAYLNSPLLDLAPFLTGIDQVKLNRSAMDTIPVPLPPVAEQEEIVRRVEALFAIADKIEFRVQATIGRVEKINQVILAKAFRGELVPTEAELARQEGRDYESASELLARIRAQRAQPEPVRGVRLPRRAPEPAAAPATVRMLDPAYPRCDRDRAACAVVLDVIRAEPGLSSDAYLDALVLAFHPAHCGNLLPASKQAAFNRLVRSWPTALRLATDKRIGWRNVRDYLEETNAITIKDRLGEQRLVVGPLFKKVRAKLPDGLDKRISFIRDAARVLRKRLAAARQGAKDKKLLAGLEAAIRQEKAGAA